MSELKEIIALIRPERWHATQKAIYDAGGTGVMQQRILGRGQQAGLHYLSMLSVDGPVTMTYLPKREVHCIVEESAVDAVVAAIIQANQTGHRGDGKIFICPLDDSIRVRTGEWGRDSI